jgi:hypothetical protein
MVTPTQQTEVRLVFLQCRLGRSELDRLFSLAPEGIDPTDITLSTQRDNTRYHAGNLESLVASVREGHAAGNLDAWENLTLEAEASGGDRKVTVTIDIQRVEVQVSGADATWVYGQAARIELFLKGADGNKKAEGGSWQEVLKLLPTMLFLAPPLVGMVLGIKWVDPEGVKARENVPGLSVADMMFGITVGFGPWLLVLVIGSLILARANRAVLNVTGEVPHGSWWSRASPTDRIALCVLITAVLGVIIAALTLAKDLWWPRRQDL